MSALFNMTIANWPAMAKGLIDANTLKTRWMRSEMKRGANRIRKAFINEQLKGPPGIKAGPLAKGKNIWTYAGGTSNDIYAKIGISKILTAHEFGTTIRPRHGAALYLHEKGKKSPIFAVVPQVVLPARLRFRQLVQRERPKELLKVAQAGARAVQQGISNALMKSF